MATIVDVIPGGARKDRTAFTKTIIRVAKRNPLGTIAAVVCAALIALAVVGPYVAPYPADLTVHPRLVSPSWDYPFGTDHLFRDMLSRILVGTRNSLGIGFGSVALATLVGVVLGLTAGYLGGWWDMLIGRVVDVSLAFPTIVFLAFFLSVLQPSYLTVCVAIGISLVPSVVRVVRASTLSVKNEQYVEAAVLVGSSQWRVMFRHILPNTAASIIIIASIQIGYAILMESALSFLGLGVSTASNPSWGQMLQEMRPYWQVAWWATIVPGLAISFAVLAFNILGDALRDELDPKLRGSR